LLSVAVHPANVQDRDGVALVLDRRTRRLFPFIELIYGDGGYQGPKAATAAAKTGRWTIVIVARSTTAVGFEVLPKRWIVERTFAWINRFRRLARDFERYARTVAAFIRLAMIRIIRILASWRHWLLNCRFQKAPRPRVCSSFYASTSLWVR